MIRCLSCGAETSNGLALCGLCQRKAEVDLHFLPIYFRNLARWRPGRAGSRPVPGSRVLYDGELPGPGTGDRISDRLDETSNALTTWARTLVDDRPYLAKLLDRLAAARQAETIDEAQMVAWLCAGFTRYLTSASTLDWCGQFVGDLSHHEARLRALTEASMPGWYAGGCTRRVTMETTCGAPTYVVPGLTWVTCGACGSTTHAADHLETILDEAREWVARPKALAAAAVALIDTEDSVPKLYTRIRQWAFVGDLPGLRRTKRDYVYDDDSGAMVVADVEIGHARYAFGDVLDMVFRDTRRAVKARAS